MPFTLKSSCDSYSLVMQGSRKALPPPCTHAATSTLAQLPSSLPPSFTSESVQFAYSNAASLSPSYLCQHPFKKSTLFWSCWLPLYQLWNEFLLPNSKVAQNLIVHKNRNPKGNILLIAFMKAFLLKCLLLACSQVALLKFFCCSSGWHQLLINGPLFEVSDEPKEQFYSESSKCPPSIKLLSKTLGFQKVN